MPYTLSDLNQMSQGEFVNALGSIFEETPTIAQAAWNFRPFKDLTHLHQTMLHVVETSGQEAQLALIRAHPDLGSKAKMAAASVAEQSGAGLNQLSPEEFERFQRLNQAYKDRFGFPFIVAVKTHTKATILQAFEERLQNSYGEEVQRAIAEIAQITRFRLEQQIFSA